MYYTSVPMPNYNQAGGQHNHSGGQHNHTLQIGEIPEHTHDISDSFSAGLVFEKDDFVINIDKGIMATIDLAYGRMVDDDIFLNNMCDCIVSRFAGHDINLFKAGNSNELKEMILNFLKRR